MKRNSVSIAIGLAFVSSIVVGAQTNGGQMPAKGDAHDMQMMKEVTYIGCVTTGPAGRRSFTLPGATTSDKAHTPAMTKDRGTPHMNDHAMHEPGMAVMLSSVDVDLKKHVGHKVSVTGTETHDTMTSEAQALLAVKSLKTLAKSCS